MATNNGDVLVRRVGALDIRDKARGTDDVEGSDTEKALGIVDTLGLENFGDDRNGRVDLDIQLSNCWNDIWKAVPGWR